MSLLTHVPSPPFQAWDDFLLLFSPEALSVLDWHSLPIPPALSAVQALSSWGRGCPGSLSVSAHGQYFLCNVKCFLFLGT